MFGLLREANFDPQVVFEPETGSEMPDVTGLAPRVIAEGFSLIVFQKVHGASVERMVRELSAAGVKTAYLVCDLINLEMAKATEVTIVVTDYLKTLYPEALQSKIYVVHDGIEAPAAYKTSWSMHRGSRKCPLEAVLVTSVDLDQLPVLETPPDWLRVTIVGRYAPADRPLQRLRNIGWKLRARHSMRERLPYLRFLADSRIRCMAWDATGVYAAMQQADIGIIPIDAGVGLEQQAGTPLLSWKVKSENRLTMKMSIGLPVIATPIPAYEPLIKAGQNGFLARTKQEWEKCLEALRDPIFRRAIGEHARASVTERYSMRAQAECLVVALRAAIDPPAGTAFPPALSAECGTSPVLHVDHGVDCCSPSPRNETAGSPRP